MVENKHKKTLSISTIILILFMMALLISIVGIGRIIFYRWSTSAKETTISIADDISEGIYNQLNNYIHVPNHINEINYKIIQNGILDINNEVLRNKFFVGVLSSHSNDIYSFSYGTVNGEYYGARRNKDGAIEIMKNDSSTGGNSWYYSVNEDMTAGELVVQAGLFDPRTREWYKSAVDKGVATFSPIYRHFIMEDLTISTSMPIYNNEGELMGVLGTHMLLSGFGDYLQGTLSKYKGNAIIIEKDSKNLIANSYGLNNFSVLSDGTFERLNIDTMKITEFREVYNKYMLNSVTNIFYENKGDSLYINIKEIHREGLDWVVISVIPQKLLYTPLVQSISLTVIIAIVALLLSFLFFQLITGMLLKPMNSLLEVSNSFTSGDMKNRIQIVRYDEIGKISVSFNKLADKMQYLINNLESEVQKRTEELHKANESLEENKDHLRLILDSAAEAIYGIDINGNCTFCNISCIKILGYEKQEELLGKNMHCQIHYSMKDKTLLAVENCKIFKAIKDRKGIHVDDEVFWKKDGSFFEVEYHAFPQMKNGEVVGAVVTFTDISERRRREEEISYISCHDILTGLYNRRCFEVNRAKIDIPENLPLSVIFADINGLKMTNDIFGHLAGDELIKKSAEILKQSCRENGVIARIGGDEFVILLPKTQREDAMKVLTRIKAEFLNARVEAIKCSISLGCDSKTSIGQSLEETMSNAENEMYKDKTLNRKSVNKNIIETILETLHSRSKREKQHSLAVSELCGKVGEQLELSEREINQLKVTGFLHDIGKIVLDKDILTKSDLTEEERIIMQQHPIVGYRILNLFDETLDIAEYVYSHHERWDGQGYPGKLKERQIPLISRIVSVVETYDCVLNKSNLPLEDRIRIAISEIRNGIGHEFDPEIAEIFINMIFTLFPSSF